MKVLSKRQMENINGGMVDETAPSEASMSVDSVVGMANELYSIVAQLAIQFEIDSAIVKAAKDKATQIQS
ncbi:hypothetical protein [uncultured Kordia sp.]|uniref:hypothetical protein n=1 Tax=uncultured Kordia sp. TaxID=507699 RepID=UPI00262E85B5|nr:hypothetical protein [uncultured Kordia sp.]